jgi:hypothetical protein
MLHAPPSFSLGQLLMANLSPDGSLQFLQVFLQESNERTSTLSTSGPVPLGPAELPSRHVRVSDPHFSNIYCFLEPDMCTVYTLSYMEA